jgi:DNA-binding protein H-NS
MKATFLGSFRSAFQEYFAPVIGIRRFAHSIARLPQLIEQEERTFLALKEMQLEQRRELEKLEAAQRQAIKELHKVTAQIGKVEALNKQMGRVEYLKKQIGKVEVLKKGSREAQRTGRNPRTGKFVDPATQAAWGVEDSVEGSEYSVYDYGPTVVHYRVTTED